MKKINELKSFLVLIIMIIPFLTTLLFCFLLSFIDQKAYEAVWEIMEGEDNFKKKK